jgi:hypothetical protein
MAFNLKKKALGNLEELILNDPGEPEPDFGVDQALVDMRWEAVGKNLYPDKATMVDALGGIDAMRAGAKGVSEDPEGARDYVDTIEQIKTFSGKPFNLKKKAQGYQIPSHEPANYQAEQMESRNQQMDELNGIGSPNQLFFSNHNELKEYLDSKEGNMQELMMDLSHNKISDAKEAIEEYYNRKREASMGIGSEEELLDFVDSNIYQLLPPNLKDEGGIVTNTDFTTLSKDIHSAINKLAQKNTKKQENLPFNFKKTAQHKTQENVIMYGPSEVRKVDPFLRQPVSDWHIVERNKGFGLVVDDVWNIDYETIWRENIMDKYSRPYKDKDGNWVGGYIQKRFEVDKNIPVTNNMQLKPGQKRKPVLPEYGNTESRLQAARAAGDIAGANNTSEPFNWKEASSKKKS